MIKIIFIVFILKCVLTNTILSEDRYENTNKYYLCIKVKKNIAEYCNNKIFGLQDSFTLKKIARNQMTESRPPINRLPLNYQRLEKKRNKSKKLSNRSIKTYDIK